MIKANPYEKVHVELPKSMNYDAEKLYCPQPVKLDGYGQMPRSFAPPYQNEMFKEKYDIARKKRSSNAREFFQKVSITSPAIPNKYTPELEDPRF